MFEVEQDGPVIDLYYYALLLLANANANATLTNYLLLCYLLLPMKEGTEHKNDEWMDGDTL